MKKILICYIMTFVPVMNWLYSQDSVVNGGFETGNLSSWTAWSPSENGGMPQISDPSIHAESSCVEITGSTYSIEQVISNLLPWNKYTLSARIKVRHAGDTVILGAKNYSGNISTAIAVTDTNFRRYSFSFVTNGSGRSATVYLSKGENTGTTGYADDFLLNNSTPLMGKTYYIDDVNGQDTADGTSPATAWQTLTKVNNTVFFPGDSILFKSNGMWAGTLHPQGEGNASRPIVLTSYGPKETRPIFNGNGASRTVYLSNQQYWEIRNLEITNPLDSGQSKRGIEIENINRGKLTHIKIIGNYVHEVYGDNMKGQNGSIGIMVVVRKNGYGNIPSWFDSVLIESNAVKNVDRTAIGTSSVWNCLAQWGCTNGMKFTPSTNVIIRNNYVENAGGDGIVPIAVKGALIEHNIVNGANVHSAKTANAGIWPFCALNTVIQNNEVYNVKTAIDGEGYDVDFEQDSTIFQYNYSHDNEGGFMLLCSNKPNANTNAIVRYNISRNDKYRIIMLNGRVQNAHIYNNTMCLPRGSVTGPIVVGNWGGQFPDSIYVNNNIFYLTSAGAWQNWDSITGVKRFDNNIVFGAHTAGEPSGSNNLFSDPLLIAPGSSDTGSFKNGIISIGNVNGYKLKLGSPSIGTGTLIQNNGGRDYWGNKVSDILHPNIGAYNVQVSNAAPSK